ncbi:IPT/TIG domain-containing protein [Candidatus Villigracilis saccharophilus]|uniref:beta strand repeat-containing protein n=1 Tax=Candidatus Villigracilis saccharophilus TaxID=3140684 RepID=UPI0031E694E5
MNSSGINIGFNSDQTMAPGQTRTYTYYADTHKLESVMISDFGGDNSGFDGLYGAMVVAPAGATFKNSNGFLTDKGALVDVFVPGQPPYRDFTLILADQDPVIGQNEMPYPEDVSGPALINYRQVLGRVDNADMFSSLVNGDPTTPILKAYAGDPVKVHVLGAPGSEQLHVFNLGGMSWPGDMYIYNSSQWQSRAVGPWEKIDIKVSGGAGGVSQAPGDYFYGDIRRPFTQAGMWGIFRVLPNTCSTGGVAGTRCLIQTPPPSVTSISPSTGPVAGGTSVTINGFNFSTTGTVIKFGANAATNVSCTSTTRCVATSPAGTGVVDVTVNVYGQVSAVNSNDRFTYVSPVPSVTGITPNSGSANGGTVVAISGTNFDITPGATTITFGGDAATNVSCSSLTLCSAETPSASVGIVDVIVTVAGQSSTASVADEFTYLDTTPPTVVSSTRLNADPTALGSVSFIVTFSEAVTGVDELDFNLNPTVTGASVTSVTGTGATRTVTVNTGTGSGTLRLDVTDDDSILDSGGNLLGGTNVGNGNFTSGESYTIDKDAPSVVSSVRINPVTENTNQATISFQVTFSEAVTSVDSADFSLTTSGSIAGASVTSVTGTGSIYTIGVNSGTGNGTIRLDILNTAAIDDVVGNALVGPYIAGQAFTIDKTIPSVTSIGRVNLSTTNLNSVVYTVTFSESVVNVGGADFVLTTSGVTGASIFGVSGTGTTRNVTVLTGTGNGTIRLDVRSTATINDVVGNAFVGPYTAGPLYDVDKTIPTVTSITWANANPTNRNSVVYTVTFSEAVLNAGSLDFILTTGGGVTGASIFGVSGTGTTRSVTVLTGTGNGTIRLDVRNTATINDVAGNALVGPYTAGQVFDVDKTIPTVMSITRVNPGTTNLNAVVYTVTFSEAVLNAGSLDFILTTGGGVTGASIFGVSGTGTTRSVTVLTGTGNGTIRLDVRNTATINDVAGNALVGPYTAGQVFDVDKTIPTVTSITRVNPGTTNLNAVVYTVTFSEAVLNAGGLDFILTTGVE